MRVPSRCGCMQLEASATVAGNSAEAGLSNRAQARLLCCEWTQKSRSGSAGWRVVLAVEELQHDVSQVRRNPAGPPKWRRYADPGANGVIAESRKLKSSPVQVTFR